MLVDNAAMQLVSRPADFDVIITENLFGDILSDEAAMITGSIGLLPSASLGPRLGLREPVHGSARTIAGQGIANPITGLPVRAMMLRYSLSAPAAADRIDAAVDAILAAAAARATSAATSARPMCATGCWRRSTTAFADPSRTSPRAGSREDLDERGLVDWADARVHVLSHGNHYGTSVFEGIRAYDADGGTAVFGLDDHLQQLERSAAMYHMPLPYARGAAPRRAPGDLGQRARRLYIRPIALRGYGTMGLFPLEAPVDVAVARGSGARTSARRGLRKGIRAKISSWRRIGSSTIQRPRRRAGST